MRAFTLSACTAVMKVVTFLLILTIALLSLGVEADVVLDEDALNTPVSISNSIYYLEDQEGSLQFVDVATLQDGFTPLGTATASFGFTKSTYWFRTIVTNSVLNSENWLLEIGYPLLDEIVVYEKKQSGKLITHRAGDHQLFKDRDIENRNFLFRLPLTANEPTELFIRVKTSSSMQLPLKIYSYQSYALSSHTEYLFFGLYYGVLVALFAYNLMMVFWIKDPVYIYYAGYLLFYGSFQLTINGLAYRYLWPESIWLAERGLLFFLCLAVIFAAKFSHSMLQVSKFSARIDKIYLLTIGFFISMLPFALFADYQIVIQILSATTVMTCLLLVFSAYQSVRSGISTAKYYLMSLSIFLIGIIIYVLTSVGLIATLNISEYAIMVSSTFKVILLSFALSHRFKVLKDENTRMQTEAHDVLEQSVTERTKELKNVLDELSVANKRLEGLNNTDTLTGVRSRAYFDEHAEFIWKNTDRSNEELAIMMLDIDNFKLINDNYGHLIGDEVLISVAQAINTALTRSTDQMARYGGEEFIVILPAAEPGGVISLAEKIRSAIEAINTQSFGISQAVTISIGVTIERPSNSDRMLRDAIENADKALYQAKNNGKNCVVVHEYIDITRNSAPTQNISMGRSA